MQGKYKTSGLTSEYFQSCVILQELVHVLVYKTIYIKGVKLILHTNLTIPECIERLTQPFLSDPDTADTANIIKRPSLPQTGEYYTKLWQPFKWAIFITSSGDNFEIKMLGCSRTELYGKDQDPGVSYSVSCSMKANSSGGTDIECKKVGQLHMPIIIGAFANTLCLLSGSLPILIHMSYDMKMLMHRLIAPFFGVTMFSIFKIVHIVRCMKLINFAADLLDARE